MANKHETTALNIISDAYGILEAQYSVVNGAEARRDQIKAFMALVFTSVEQLAQEAGGDGSYIAYEFPSAAESIDAAFLDQIERENDEPRLEQYSTMNNETQGIQAVFKPRPGLVKLLNGGRA